MVEYHPISAKDLSRYINLIRKSCQVYFSVMRSTWENLERRLCGRRHWRIGGDGCIWTPRRRLNAKEVLTPQRSGNFIFTAAHGTVQIYGRGKRLRHSTFFRTLPEQGEEKWILQFRWIGFSNPTSRRLDAGWWGSQRWHLDDYRRIHLSSTRCTPSVKLYVPKEESFPFPLKYIDLTRTTCTSPDVMWEKHFQDYRNVDREKELSDARTGSTSLFLLKERPPEGFSWSRKRLTRKQKNFSSWRRMARYVNFFLRCSKKESQTKMGYRETKARQCQTVGRNIAFRNKTLKNSSSQWKPLVESWKFRCQQ